MKQKEKERWLQAYCQHWAIKHHSHSARPSFFHFPQNTHAYTHLRNAKCELLLVLLHSLKIRHFLTFNGGGTKLASTVEPAQSSRLRAGRPSGKHDWSWLQKVGTFVFKCSKHDCSDSTGKCSFLFVLMWKSLTLKSTETRSFETKDLLDHCYLGRSVCLSKKN